MIVKESEASTIIYPTLQLTLEKYYTQLLITSLQVYVMFLEFIIIMTLFVLFVVYGIINFRHSFLNCFVHPKGTFLFYVRPIFSPFLFLFKF